MLCGWISANVSEITDHSTVCSSGCSLNSKRNINSQHYWPFVRGIRQWPMKALPCHDAIMEEGTDMQKSNTFMFFSLIRCIYMTKTETNSQAQISAFQLSSRYLHALFCFDISLNKSPTYTLSSQPRLGLIYRGGSWAYWRKHSRKVIHKKAETN